MVYCEISLPSQLACEYRFKSGCGLETARDLIIVSALL